ncbi:mitochondrial ribosomal subunit protein-domain-containing protein [Boletus edulis BED1]|uniref:Mitochondrial ribosomal subunit protein-domain-containing protein n=1 Tax=Boletus edulis BED1 TaxID=1328754 RepID=A0AAD4C1A1_BOLED|nr:mitochondrial ribosomal subunit protein-domain-containing protein [Boletus edulis BED1]
MPLPRDLVDFDIEEDFPEFSGNDIPSGAHIALHQQRQLAYYMRLIENEMPKFVAFRKPFVPPSTSTPLVIRSVDYAGEEHPLTGKRTVVVPVTQLPLRGDLAIHKIKLLAGARWAPHPPKNAGVPLDGEQGRYGYISIACEDFPQPAMNLKWISDTIDELISTANDGTPTSYQDLPVDTRHIEAKVKKGGHVRRRGTRSSLRDFPKEWLPQLPFPQTDVVRSAHP